MDKGWVREGILSGLSVEPSTLTEVSQKLGVSKSTASYHLSLLMDRGAIEIVDSKEGRGGVQVRRYGLKAGSSVTLLSRREEEAELGKLRETFDLEVLPWRASAKSVTLENVQGLLYKMFLHLFKLGRSEHRTLMREYGTRTGDIVAEGVSRMPFRDTLGWLAGFLGSSGISECNVLELPNSSIIVLASNTCIGATSHQTNSCYFLEGMIEGILRKKLGPSVKVGRVDVPGLASCLLAVGRAKRLELDWVADNIITSPEYSAIERGGSS